MILAYILFRFFPEKLVSWNGEICETAINGISFKKRVLNFYLVFIIFIPMVTILISSLLAKFNLFNDIKLPAISLNNNLFAIFTISIIPLLIISYFINFKLDYSSLTHGEKLFVFYSVIKNINLWAWLFKCLLIILFSTIPLYKLNSNFVKFVKQNSNFFIIINIVSIVYSTVSIIQKVFVDFEKINSFLTIINLNNLILCILLLYSMLYMFSFINMKAISFICVYDITIRYFVLIISLNLFTGRTIVSAIITLLVFTFYLFRFDNKFRSLFNKIVLSFTFTPLIYVLVIQIVLVFRSHVSFNINFIILLICSLLISFVLSFFCNHSFNNKIYYVISIIAIALISHGGLNEYISFDYINYANVFELGNNTVAYDTISTGALPILKYFPAHALYDIWTQIIYTVLNSDKLGLFANPYGFINNVLGMVVLYLFLASIIDNKIAALLCIVFPLNIIGFKIVTFSLISILMFYLVFRSQRIKTFIIFWLVVGLNAIYIYDAGMTLGIACIITFAFYLFLNKKYKDLRTFLLIGFIVGIIALAFAVVYLLVNGINPTVRILEWKSLTLNSFSALARLNIGNYFSLPYFITYFALPSIASIYILYTLVYNLSEIDYFACIGMVFTISQIFYISRGIAFHNLAVCRGATGVLMNYVPWTILLFTIVVICKFRQIGRIPTNIFVLIFTMCILLSIFITHKLPDGNSNLIANSLNNSCYRLDNISSKSKYKRISPIKETGEFYSSFDKIFNLLLKKEETFIDFANITSLYAFTNRERPFYISQSPGLLSDLNSQEQFLTQISSKSIPIVIIGNTWEGYIHQIYGMHHNIRYYTIAEYIYSNYRPLILNGDFAIWCHKDKYEEYSYIVSNSNYKNDIIEFGYDINSVDDPNNMCHNYSICDLPYIEANYNNLKPNYILVNELNKVMDRYEIQNVKIDSNYSYFLKFYINCDVDEDAIIIISDKNSKNLKASYKFRVHKGKNEYILRLSNDYYWYNNLMNTLTYENNNLCDIEKIELIKEVRNYK